MFSLFQPLKLEHTQMDALNRLVGYLLEISFQLIKQAEDCSEEQQKLSNEIYRALGSLIYQNGPKLNEKNLQLLLKNQNSNKGLLLLILNRIELQTINLSDESKSKLKLLLTQLVFNLTMPVRTLDASHTGSVDVNSLLSYTTCFIQDIYKSTCAYVLIRIIRNHNLNALPLNSPQISSINKHFSETKSQCENDQTREDNSRLLIKALQSLENLFGSIECDKNQLSIPIVQVDWLQAPSNEYQLSDILAIVKVMRHFLSI